MPARGTEQSRPAPPDIQLAASEPARGPDREAPARPPLPDPAAPPMSMGRARRLGLGAPLEARPETSLPVSDAGRPASRLVAPAPGATADAASGAVDRAATTLPAPRRSGPRPFAAPDPGPLPMLHAHEPGDAAHSTDSHSRSAAAAPLAGTGFGRGPRSADTHSTAADGGSHPAVQRSTGGQSLQPARSGSVASALPVTTGGSAVGQAAGHSPATTRTPAPPLPPTAARSQGFGSLAPARVAGYIEQATDPYSDAAEGEAIQRSAVSEVPAGFGRSFSFEPPGPSGASSEAVIARAPAGGAAGESAAGAAGASAAGSSAGHGAAGGAPSEDQLDHLAGQVYSRIRDRLGADLLRERERAGLLADL